MLLLVGSNYKKIVDTYSKAKDKPNQVYRSRHKEQRENATLYVRSDVTNAKGFHTYVLKLIERKTSMACVNS